MLKNGQKVANNKAQETTVFCPTTRYAATVVRLKGTASFLQDTSVSKDVTTRILGVSLPSAKSTPTLTYETLTNDENGVPATARKVWDVMQRSKNRPRP